MTFRPRNVLKASALNNSFSAQTAQLAAFDARLTEQRDAENLFYTADYTNAEARSLADYLDGHPVDLLTWWEDGDGTNIQPAITRAVADGAFGNYKHVRLPRGTWFVGGSVFYALVLSNVTGLRVSGWGKDVTILKASPNANVGFANLTNMTNCVFEDFEFNGDRANQTLGGRHGFRGNSLTGCALYRVRIREALGYGVEMGTGALINNTFEDVEIIDAGYDGIDHKNRTATNFNNTYTRVRVTDWSRRDTTQSASAFDIRGGATLIACEARITAAPGTALIGFTCRPDDSWELQFSGATGTITTGRTVTGGTSGASGSVGYVEQDGTTGLMYLRAVRDGVFVLGETLTFSGGGGLTAVVAAEQTSVPTGGRAVQFLGCRAVGPGSAENTGSGFSINNDEAMVIACHAKGLRKGFASGLQANRATLIAPVVEDCITGIVTTGDGLQIIGGSLTGCTESAIELSSATSTHVAGVGFDDCAIGIWHRGASAGGSYVGLRMTNVATPYSGSVPTSDYVAVACPGLENALDGGLRLTDLPTYANNAAALAGSLAVGDCYQTATGELRIVV